MKNYIFKISAFNINAYWISCFLLLILLACKKEDKIEVSPEIRNISVSKDTLMQGSGNEEYFLYSFTFLNQFGELGFSSESDSILLNFYDLRFATPFPLTFVISQQEMSNSVEIMNGNIEVKVPTTCCAFVANNPCDFAPGFFEPVSYEVQYKNNLGYDLPRDTIDFVIDCSF